MFQKGLLYARIEWNPEEPTELIYPLEDWSDRPGMPQMSIVTFVNGTQPSMRRVTFEGNPEGHKGRFGNTIRFVRATDEHLFYMLNMWNDSGRFGWVEGWLKQVEQNCTELHPMELGRLARFGKKGRYWNGQNVR